MFHNANMSVLNWMDYIYVRIQLIFQRNTLPSHWKPSAESL